MDKSKFQMISNYNRKETAIPKYWLRNIIDFINLLLFFLASCGNPGLIDRGRRIGNDFSHGQIVTYQCRQGYSLEGSQKLKCNNGHWDAAAPQCKGESFLLFTHNNSNHHDHFFLIFLL